MQGAELIQAVAEGLKSVNLLADKAADKLVSSYRLVKTCLDGAQAMFHDITEARTRHCVSNHDELCLHPVCLGQAYITYSKQHGMCLVSKHGLWL